MYPRILNEVVSEQKWNINLNCNNLFQFDPELYRELVNYPSDLIPLFDLVIHHIREKTFPDQQSDERIQIRAYNLQRSTNMRSLNPVDIDTLVSVKGMVIRVGEIIPEMRTAFFECLVCNWSTSVVIEEGIIPEPTECRNCAARYTMQMVHNRGTFANRQVLKIQETPDAIPEGETPHTISVHAYDALIDIAKPGDRVEITGVYKAMPARASKNRRQIKALYTTHLDAIHFKKTDSRRMAAESSRAEEGIESSHTPLHHHLHAYLHMNPSPHTSTSS